MNRAPRYDRLKAIRRIYHIIFQKQTIPPYQSLTSSWIRRSHSSAFPPSFPLLALQRWLLPLLVPICCRCHRLWAGVGRRKATTAEGAPSKRMESSSRNGDGGGGRPLRRAYLCVRLLSAAIKLGI